MRAIPVLVLILLLAGVSLQSEAQVSNINPSISIIAGEPYYLHTVLAGQDIEAIATAYFTKPQPISQANPGLIAGLKPGMELKIPCSFESYGAMSELEVTKKKKEPARPIESKAPEVFAAKPEKKSQVTPLEEAVGLLEEEKPVVEPDPAPSTAPTPTSTRKPEVVESQPEEQPVMKAAVAESQPQPQPEPQAEAQIRPETQPNTSNDPTESLEELSQSISESLEALRAMRAEVESNVTEEELAAPKEPEALPPPSTYQGTRLNEFGYLQKAMDQAFEPDSSEQELSISETFFITIGPQGIVRKLSDERTETNENTRILNVSEIQNLRCELMQKEQLTGSKEPIGFYLNATKHVYELNIKKKKIRMYETGFLVENMKKDHPHFEIIRAAADEKGMRGKCHLVIIEGSQKLVRHRQFEYNPFGDVDRILAEEEFQEIRTMEFL